MEREAKPPPLGWSAADVEAVATADDAPEDTIAAVAFANRSAQLQALSACVEQASKDDSSLLDVTQCTREVELGMFYPTN